MRNKKTLISLFIALILSTILALIFTKAGVEIGLVVSIIPLVIFIVILSLYSPFFTYVLLFIANYYLIGLSRYLPGLKPGITFDILLLFVFGTLIFQILIRKKIYWRRAFNFGTGLSLIWALYCILEIFNPWSLSLTAWTTLIRGIALYMIIIIAYTSIMVTDFKKVKIVLFIWSILTLTAVLNTLTQKFIGFNYAEQRWLNEGGSVTHIIGYGIRYFSFFSDAGNFGSSMGHSAVIFTGLAIYYKDIRYKIYYLVVALAAGYVLLLSGTRGAQAVPAVGFFMIAMLSKNIRVFISTFIVLIFAIVFLGYTTIGNSYQVIRRARTVFDRNDASYLVRVENQKILRNALKDKPFGIGLGHKTQDNGYLADIATDSWYVLLFVETGIIGVVINVLIYVIILGYGMWLVFFGLKNRNLSNIIGVIISGVLGIMATSLGNEVLGQFPTGMLTYMSLAIIIMSPYYDKQLTENAQSLIHSESTRIENQ